jgi:hypothetical protein
MNHFGWPTCSLLMIVVVLAIAGCRHSPDVYRTPTNVDPIVGVPGWLGISGFSVRGVDYGIALPESVLEASVPWSMDRGKNPPLLPGRAISLAQEALVQEFADAGLWSIIEITIATYPRASEDASNALRHRPYYQIEFAPPEMSEIQSGGFPVWVLMNGTVVLPRGYGSASVELGE